MHREGAHNCDALLLPAREHARIGFFLVREIHAREELSRFRLCLFPASLLHLCGRERNVIENIHMREQVIALKHHAELLPHRRQRTVFQSANGFAVQPDFAALNLFEAVDAAEKG